MEINNNTQTTNSTNNKNNSTSDENSTSSFNDLLNQKSKIEDMVADLLSLINTGLTVSELERLEELLAKVKEEIKDGIKTSDERKQIEEMLTSIEEAIAQLMKRINGEAIIKKDDKKLVINETPFEQRIKDIETMIEDLKDGYIQDKEDKKLVNELTSNKKLNFLDRLVLNKSQDMIDKEFEKSEDKQEEKQKTKLDEKKEKDMELFESIIEDQYIKV